MYGTFNRVYRVLKFERVYFNLNMKIGKKINAS